MDPVSIGAALAKLGSFALKNWKWFALGGLVLALGLTNARLDHAKADLRTARAALVDPATGRKWKALAEERGRDLGTCRESNRTLSGSLDTQTAAVRAWKAEADKRSAEGAKAMQKARTATLAAEKRAAGILAAKPGADQCQSAEALILEALK